MGNLGSTNFCIGKLHFNYLHICTKIEVDMEIIVVSSIDNLLDQECAYAHRSVGKLLEHMVCLVRGKIFFR